MDFNAAVGLSEFQEDLQHSETAVKTAQRSTKFGVAGFVR